MNYFGILSSPIGYLIALYLLLQSVGVINRVDVATMIVQALGSSSCTRKEFTAIDPTIASAFTEDGSTPVVAHNF